MKVTVITFILVDAASTSLSQINFNDLAIGDSIKKFGNNIICAEIGLDNRTIGNDTCTAFRFLAAKHNVISIAKVDFSELLFIVDSNKIIKSVYLSKPYLTTDSLDARDQSNADYKTLRSYFENLTRSKGKKNKSEWLKTQRHFITEITWKTNRYKYFLTKTQFAKRAPQQKVLFTVSFLIERQDN